MKKLLSLLFVVAIVFCGCSDTQKAKSLAKDYLKKNSNDGKIEVVEWGELEDYEYVDDFEKRLALNEVEHWTHQAESEMDIYDIWKGTDMSEAKPHLELAEIFLAKADSAKKVADNAKVETYPIHKMKVKARGNNALGNKVVDDIVLYFNKKVTYCSADAGDARSK